MVEKIIPLHSMFFLNTKLFTNCLEGVTKELYAKMPNAESNNIAFLACHTLDARFYMAEFTGLQLANPFKEVFDKIRKPDQFSDFPPVEDIFKIWKEISKPIEEKLMIITEDELIKEAPLQLPLVEKTVLGGITFLLQHEAYHIGQIALLRRIYGLPAMKYI